MTPDVSVAIPVYNGRDFLPECLGSVLSQTGVSFEIVAVDDASSDDTAAILGAVSDPRLRIHRHAENRGIFHTLNDAIRACRAAFVQILCQDDLMKPDCLRQQTAFLAEDSDVAMAWANYRDIDIDGRPCGQRTLPEYHDLLPPVLTPRDAAVYFLVFGCMPGNLSPVILRREAFDGVGGFDNSMTYAGDFDLWVRLAGRYPLRYNRETLFDVRTHREQASHSLNARSLDLIAEEARVYTALKMALGDRMASSRLDDYLAAVRGYQYISWVTMHLRKGHPRVVLDGLRNARRSLGLLRCLLAYAASLNGRRRLVDKPHMLRQLLQRDSAPAPARRRNAGDDASSSS